MKTVLFLGFAAMPALAQNPAMIGQIIQEQAGENSSLPNVPEDLTLPGIGSINKRQAQEVPPIPLIVNQGENDNTIGNFDPDNIGGNIGDNFDPENIGDNFDPDNLNSGGGIINNIRKREAQGNLIGAIVGGQNRGGIGSNRNSGGGFINNIRKREAQGNLIGAIVNGQNRGGFNNNNNNNRRRF